MEGTEGNTGSSTLDIWMQLDKFTSQTEEGEKNLVHLFPILQILPTQSSKHLRPNQGFPKNP